MKSSRILSWAAALCLGTAVSVCAQTWTEQGDAGDLVSTSQQPAGTGPLLNIIGTLGGLDTVDMYCIDILDRTHFTATLQSTDLAGSPLWLFDPNSTGITSQEGWYISTPSQITGTYVLNPGTYYLAVSLHDIFAQDPGGSDIWTINPRSTEIPPDGPGAPGPLASWFGVWGQAGSYTLVLTSTGYCGGSVPALRGSWGKVKSLYR